MDFVQDSNLTAVLHRLLKNRSEVVEADFHDYKAGYRREHRRIHWGTPSSLEMYCSGGQILEQDEPRYGLQNMPNCIRFCGQGSALEPAGEAYSAAPEPVAGISEVTEKGKKTQQWNDERERWEERECVREGWEN